MPAKNRVEVPCTQCGKHVERTQSQIRNAKHTFCSQVCKCAWLKAHPRNRVVTQCNSCGKPIERTAYYIKKLAHHFCNRQCHARWLETQTGNLSAHYNSVTVQCEMCSKDVQKPPNRIRRNKHTFCSQVCKFQYKSKHYTGPNSANWNGGAANDYGPNWVSQSRKARERDAGHCQLCGKSQEDNKRALDVHHIVPFKKFNYIYGQNDNYLQANELSNLVSLCMVCHHEVEAGRLPIPNR